MYKKSSSQEAQNSSIENDACVDEFNEIRFINKRTKEVQTFVIDYSNSNHISLFQNLLDTARVRNGSLKSVFFNATKSVPANNKGGRPKKFFTNVEEAKLGPILNEDTLPKKTFNAIKDEFDISSLSSILSKYGTFNESKEDYESRIALKIENAIANDTYDPDDYLPPEQRRDFYYIEKNLEWYMFSLGLNPENPDHVQKVKQYGTVELSIQSLDIKNVLAKKLIVDWLLINNIGFYKNSTLMVHRDMLNANQVLNIISFLIATKGIRINYYGGKKNRTIPISELIRIYKIFGVACTPAIIRLHKTHESKILKNKIHQSPSCKKTFGLFNLLYKEYKQV